MSTAVLAMQSVSAQQRDLDLKFNASANPALYGPADHWAPSPPEDSSYTSMTEYTGFPVDSTNQTEHSFTGSSTFPRPRPNQHDLYDRSMPESMFKDFKMQSGMNAALQEPFMAMYGVPTTFMSSDAQMRPYDAVTISPLDTHFGANRTSPGSDTKSTFGSLSNPIAPSDFAPFANHEDSSSSSSKRRCDSLQSNLESHSSPTTQSRLGRRRGSEYAEPGSARAVYLEKNRKAASKCRSKQKRQQDELVETARDVERRNKILKAEVEILKSDMRDLMGLVGQHTECPDARLHLYVQREADRLVAQGRRGSIPTSSSGRSPSGPPYSEKASPADDDWRQK